MIEGATGVIGAMGEGVGSGTGLGESEGLGVGLVSRTGDASMDGLGELAACTGGPAGPGRIGVWEWDSERPTVMITASAAATPTARIQGLAGNVGRE